MPSATRGRPRAFDPDAALDAAVGVFMNKGYEAAGVAELCTAMGIAKQSMYDWVQDKRGLYLAALQHFHETRVCGFGKLLKAEGSPLANLRQCLHMMADYAKSPECKGCLLTNAQGEFGTSDPKVHQATQEVEEYIVQEFTAVLDRAKKAGEIAESVDTESVGRALAVLRNGLMIAGRAGQSAESIDQTINLIEAMLQPTSIKHIQN